MRVAGGALGDIMAFTWMKEAGAAFARASGRTLTQDDEKHLFFRALRKHDLKTLRKTFDKYSQQIFSWTSGKKSPLDHINFFNAYISYTFREENTCIF